MSGKIFLEYDKCDCKLDQHGNCKLDQNGIPEHIKDIIFTIAGKELKYSDYCSFDEREFNGIISARNRAKGKYE